MKNQISPAPEPQDYLTRLREQLSHINDNWATRQNESWGRTHSFIAEEAKRMGSLSGGKTNPYKGQEQPHHW